MQNPPGTFIVIEGSDGSGKQTQVRLLGERLRAVGYAVAEFDFPRYDNQSSYFVRQYLEGKYGPASKISPYAASLFYAMDRFEAAEEIRQALKDGKVVLSNRYAGANMAHQGSKLNDPIEQRSFFVWADSLEFQLLGIPRPSINLFLRVPAEISSKLIKERAMKSGVKLDEHEKDNDHLKKTVATFDTLCKIFPQDFVAIECAKNDRLLGIPEINNLLWEAVAPYLPKRPTGSAHAVTINMDEVAQHPKSAKLSSEPRSNKTKTTYQPGKLSLDTILEIERIIPGTSKYQLSWEKNGYDYIVPSDLTKNTRAKYEELMEALGDLHKLMRDMLKKNPDKDSLLAPAIPMGALLDVELSLSPADIQELVRQFDLAKPEAQSLFGGLLRQGLGKTAAKSMSAAMVKKPSQVSSVEEIITKLVREHLPSTIDDHTDNVTLLEAMPRNEFKILADALYPYSNLPRDALETEIDKLTYQQKYDTLVGSLARPEGTVADRVVYKFDLVADKLTLDKITKSGLANVIKVQPPTPRYGYDVPESINQLGIEDQYLSAFDKSLELFSTLQAAGREDVAGYATLLGHKVRFQLECSLTRLKSALNNPPTELKQLYDEMVGKVAELHPIIGENLSTLFKNPAQNSTPKQSNRRRRNRRRGKPKKT